MFEISENLFNALVLCLLTPLGMAGVIFAFCSITYFWKVNGIKTMLSVFGLILSLLMLVSIPLNSALGSKEVVDNPINFEKVDWKTYIKVDKEALSNRVADEINVNSISFNTADRYDDDFKYKLADGEPVEFTSVSDDGLTKGVLYFTEDSMKIIVFSAKDQQKTFTVLTG